MRQFEVLLGEDNPADVRLAQEALEDTETPVRLNVVPDGVEMMAFLRREGSYADVARPDLILLDLNMPRKDGREVLAEIKGDESLKAIPVLILTTSQAEQDIEQAYNLHANAYLIKQLDLESYLATMRTMEDFWFTTAKLPKGENHE